MGEDGLLISAIVVSYNTREMTLQCLRALQADLAGVPSDIWLVDNASSDGSVEAVGREFPDVHVIRNPQNVGFGAANNQALRQAKGEFYLLVNSDAFLQPGAVAALLACARAHPEAAVVGPRLLNPDGALQMSCYRFPSPLQAWSENLWLSKAFPGSRLLGDYSRWAHDWERSVDWVVGACMLVRSETVRQVGGFDERFFMYAEETDWQLLMRRAGWEIMFTPAAVVVHLAGGSGEAKPLRANAVAFQSLDYYLLKNHGWPGLVVFRAAMIVGCLLRCAAWAGVFLLSPARRQVAGTKARLMAWLLVRQLFCWRSATERTHP